MTNAEVAHRTTNEVTSGERVLLLPLGALEQHGPHLPLGLDTMIATAVCTRAAAERSVDVAPALPFGASDEHHGFAGGLSLGTTGTALALAALVRSALATWCGVVIVSAHGGNVDAVAEGLESVAVHRDRVRAWFARDPTGDPHAGATETSVALALTPSPVRLDRVPEGESPPAGWWEVARRQGVAAISPSGVLGRPRAATLSDGRALLRRWCDEVVALVDELRGTL